VTQPHCRQMESAAQALGLSLQVLTVRDPPSSPGRSMLLSRGTPKRSTSLRARCSTPTSPRSQPLRPRAGSQQWDSSGSL